MSATSGFFTEQRLELPFEDYIIIGIPDVIQIENGIVNILDWKTNRKGIRFKSMYDVSANKTKKLKYPLSAIDDVNGQHYTIQLSLYMWMILQLRPDLKPGTLSIKWIQDMKVKKSFDVPYMEKEVSNLIKWYIKDLKLKEETNNCKELQF